MVCKRVQDPILRQKKKEALLSSLTVTKSPFKPRVWTNAFKILVDPRFFAHSSIKTRVWMTRRFGWSYHE